jgi:pyruvyl transferase EpsI
MRIQSFLPKPFRPFLRKVRSFLLRVRFEKKLSRARGKRKLFYLMGLSESFPNLGDQAMAAAVPGWIAKNFQGEIIECAFNEDFDYLGCVIKSIELGDLVFLHSGGNFGDTWVEQQLVREQILVALRGFPVIQLPQTVYFSDTKQGRERLSETAAAIGQHGQFRIVARDQTSAAAARAYFPQTDVLCYPDMALLLDPVVQKIVRPTLGSVSVRRVLVILRADKEAALSTESKSQLNGLLSNYEIEYWDTDPIVDIFPKGDRTETLLKYLRYIASFDAVVTDRFHGLIFSLLTRRPCVVLATYNHKIPSALDWFTDIPFVKLAPSPADVPGLLSQVASVPVRTVPDWESQFFTPMAQALGADK